MNNLVLVYFDQTTNRGVRATEWLPSTCPADLDDLKWFVLKVSDLPVNVLENDNIRLVEYRYMIPNYRLASDILSEDEIIRFAKLNEKAECLEKLSRNINYIRFLKNRNMFLNAELVNEYYKEIEAYNETNTIGPLLSSLTDDQSEINSVIGNFKIKNSTYQQILLNTEIFYNKWSRKIKESENPFDALKDAQIALGAA